MMLHRQSAFLLLITGYVVSATAVHTSRTTRLLGEDECNYGASQWCQNITTAAKCLATNYCVSKQWSLDEFEQDSDTVCDACKAMVVDVRQQLAGNMTKERVKVMFDQFCGQLPLDAVVDTCLALSDAVTDELRQVVSSHLDPQVVCNTLVLCNSPHIDSLLERQSRLRSASVAEYAASETECQGCQQQFDVITSHLARLTDQDLINALVPVCREMGSYSDSCSTHLVQNMPLVRPLLQSAVTEAVTAAAAAAAAEGAAAAAAGDGDGSSSYANSCDLCVHIVKRWQDILVNNSTEQEFKQLLENVCQRAQVPTNKCLNYVDEYYGIMYNFLKNVLNAHTLCKSFGVCSTAVEDTSSKPVVAANIVLTDPVTAARATLHHVTLTRSDVLPAAGLTVSAAAAAAADDDDKEEAADDAADDHDDDEVTAAAADDDDKEEAAAAADDDDKEEAAADDDDDDHDDDITVIRMNFDHDTIDHKNPMDTAMDDQDVEQVDTRALSPSSSGSSSSVDADNSLPLGDGTVCAVCEAVLGQLQRELEDASVQDEITHAVLKDACGRLSGHWQTICSQYVTKYGDLVIDLLSQQVNANQICPSLHACPQPSKSADSYLFQPSSAVADVTGVECEICRQVMERVLNYLSDPKSAEDVRKALDKVCATVLPHHLSVQCQELVNTFSGQLVDYIVAGMTAEQICQELQLCHKTLAISDNNNNNNDIVNFVKNIRVGLVMPSRD